MNILSTSDQLKNLCELYCLPTIQLQPVTQVQTHRAAPTLPASPGNVFSPLLPSPFLSISEQLGKQKGHPKYPFPGSRQPLTLFPDACEHSSCRNTLSIPLQRPYNLPNVLPCMLLIFLTSTAATQPQSSAHCQTVNDCRKPLLTTLLPLPPVGQAQALKTTLVWLWYLTDAELTARCDLLCRESPPSPSSFPPTSVNRHLEPGCWFVKGSLPPEITFQEARNCSLQSAWFLFPKVTSCVCALVCAPQLPSFKKYLCMWQSPSQTCAVGVWWQCHAAWVLVVPVLAVCTS